MKKRFLALLLAVCILIPVFAVLCVLCIPLLPTTIWNRILTIANPADSSLYGRCYR